MKKRIISLLLALTMVFLFIPTGVFSEGEEDIVPEEAPVEEQVAEEAPAEVSVVEEATVDQIVVEAANEAVEEQLAAEPAVEPAAEPVAEPVEEPAAEPVAEPEEPAAEPVVEHVEEPAAEPVAEPEEPAAESVVEHVEEPAAEPVAEPEEPAAESVVEHVEEPAVEPAAEPVLKEPVAESVAEPATEPTETEPVIFEIDGDILVKYKGEDEVVAVPDGIKEIGAKAFAENKTLVKVILPDSVEKIGVSAFENCSKLEKVVIGDQSKLENIASAAFKNDKKLDVSFAESVNSVANDAFDGIAVEESVAEEPTTEEPATTEPATEPTMEESETEESTTDKTTTDEPAVEETVVVEEPAAEEPVIVEPVTEEETAEEPVVEEPVVEESVVETPIFEIEGDVLKKYNGENAVVSIPDGISEIAKKAFAGNTKITMVILPDSVETIASSAFVDCTNLEKVVISDQSKLRTIGWAAFKNCIVINCAVAENNEISFYTTQWLVDEAATLSKLSGVGFIKDGFIKPEGSAQSTVYIAKSEYLLYRPKNIKEYQNVSYIISLEGMIKEKIAGYVVKDVELVFAYDGSQLKLINANIELFGAEFEELREKLTKVYGNGIDSESDDGSESIVWIGDNNTAVVLYTESEGYTYQLVYGRTDAEEILKECIETITAAPDLDDVSGL